MMRVLEKNPRCMPSSSEDLTFAKITSVGKGRKTVNLKTTMILDQNRRTEAISPCLKVEAHPCTKENRLHT
jgi:hypothetical protein